MLRIPSASLRFTLARKCAAPLLCGTAFLLLGTTAGVAQTSGGAGTAAIGFCFGGQAALELGRSGADLRAIVGFHSGLKTARPEDSKNIKAKVLVCLGDQDPLVPREARDGFVENMTASNVDCQLLLMSGVGHSFTNPDAQAFGVSGCHYDAVADRRSWAAMKELFVEAFQS